MNNKITFLELVEQMATATSTSHRVCELFLRNLFATISQALMQGESVKLKGVGTFKVTEVGSRKSVSVDSGTAIEIPSHKRVSFTPDKSLAEAVNQPFAQFESVELDDAVTDALLANIDEELIAEQEDGKQQLVDEVPQPRSSLADTTVANVTATTESLSSPIEEPSHVASKQVITPPPFRLATTAVGGDTERVETTSVNSPTVAQTETNATTHAPSHHPQSSGPTLEPQPQVKTVDNQDVEAEPSVPEHEPYAAIHSPQRKRWLWLIPMGLVILGLAAWMSARNHRLAEGEGGDVTIAATDTATRTTQQPAPATVVVTDQVTRQAPLSVLAQRHYGSQWFWVYIYEENRDKISDPNNVPPGTIVVIPPADKYGIDAHDQQSLKQAQLASWRILKGQ